MAGRPSDRSALAEYALGSEQDALTRQVALATGLDSFRIFGGAAVDLTLGPCTELVRDIDVAMPYDQARFLRVLHRLKLLGANIYDVRMYWLRWDAPVLMAKAQLGKLSLDINALDNLETLGLFDLDSVYWVYPESVVIDPFDGLASAISQQLRLVRPIEVENPLLILSRLVTLSAKYGINLSMNHIDLIAALNTAIAAVPRDDEFHGRQALQAYERHVYRAVTRNPSQSATILLDLAVSGALWSRTNAIPTIDEASAIMGQVETSSVAEFWRSVEENLQTASAPREVVGSPSTESRARRPLRWPLIGIVVPTLNESSYIYATLDSLGRQLHEGRPFEPGEIVVIVADGGSIDGTEDIVAQVAEQHPHIEFEFLVDSGGSVVSGRIAGYRSLLKRRTNSPPYLISIDADTVFPPSWVESTVAALERGADVVATAGSFGKDFWSTCRNTSERYAAEVGTIFFDSETERLYQSSERTFTFTTRLFEHFGRPVADCGFGFRRDLYEALGGFHFDTYADGTLIQAVGWPFEFRADAIGARTVYLRGNEYVSSPRRLVGEPQRLFDGSAYTSKMEEFRSETDLRDFDSRAGSLDMEELAGYVVKNYILQRCVTRPERMNRNPDYFGALFDHISNDIFSWREEMAAFTTAQVFDFASILHERYGAGILDRLVRMPQPTGALLDSGEVWAPE